MPHRTSVPEINPFLWFEKMENNMSKVQTQDLPKVIDAFLSAIHAGDVETIVNHYSKDAIVQAPMGDIVKGHHELTTYWKNIAENYPMSNLNYRKIALQDMGPDHVSELTEFEGEAGGVKQTGRYCQIWRRENGTWKLMHDTYNIMLPN
jgi:ketosteroid isomerase-like protein